MPQNSAFKTSVVLAAGQSAKGFFDNGRRVPATLSVLSLSDTVTSSIQVKNAPLFVNERQTITIAGTPTGGSFTINLPDFNRASGGAATTAAIAYTQSNQSANQAAVQAALDELTVAIDPVKYPAGTIKAYCSASPSSGATFILIFTGFMGGRNLTLSVVSITGLTGGSPTQSVAETTAGAGPNQGATYNVYADGYGGLGSNKLIQGVFASSPSGNFTLTITPADGTPTVTTGNIAYNATQATLAGNIQTALDAALGAGNARAFSPAGATAATYPIFLIEFTGRYGQKTLTVTKTDPSGAGTLTLSDVYAGSTPSGAAMSVAPRGNATFSFSAGGNTSSQAANNNTLGPRFEIACTAGYVQIEIGLAQSDFHTLRLNDAA